MDNHHEKHRSSTVNSAPDDELEKRKARRRFVGATTLAIIAIILLPFVFEGKPSPQLSPVKIFMVGSGAMGMSPPEGLLRPPAQGVSSGQIPPPSSTGASLSVPPVAGEETTHHQSTAATAQSGGESLTQPAFFIMLAAYEDYAVAKIKLGKIEKMHPAAALIEQQLKGHKVWRIRIGPFSDHHKTEQLLQRFKEQGFDGVVSSSSINKG